MQLTLIFPHFDLFHARNEEHVSQLPLPLKFVVSDQTSPFVADYLLSFLRAFFFSKFPHQI